MSSAQYSIVGFQDTSALIIEQDGTGNIKRIMLQKNLHSEKISTFGKFTHEGTEYYYTGSSDKFMKFWKLQDEQLVLVSSSVLQKKITHSFYSNVLQKHFATDKYGDIYSFSIKNILKTDGDLFAEYENSNNLAIQQAFKDINLLSGTSLCVLGDSYSKIKMFDLRNMHDLVNFWVPQESHLIQILEFPSQVVLFFQMKDSQTYEKRYLTHLVEKESFVDPKYKGVSLESIIFPDDTIKARIEKKSDTEFAIFTLTKKLNLIAQVFNLEKKEIVKSESTQILSETLTQEPGQKIFMHTTQLEQNSALALVGIKANTPSEYTLESTAETGVELASQKQTLTNLKIAANTQLFVV